MKVELSRQIFKQ